MLFSLQPVARAAALLAVSVPLFSSSVAAVTVASTVLVLARDATSAFSATSGLNGYGIPYEVVTVPSTGAVLPTLGNNATATGNYGAIIVLSEVSYQYPTGFLSALTAAQWQQLFDYQTQFSVRMARLDVFPTAEFGTTTAIAGAGCCSTGVEQLLSFSNITAFPTAGLRSGAGVSTQGLWHYPATITNTSTTVEIAKFDPSGSFTTATTAAVINTNGARQQMVWFISVATDWNMASNFIQHAWIHWLTRGLYGGIRRTYFSTQIDDMFLSTGLYQPNGTDYQIEDVDLAAHVVWQASLNKRLPTGSNYTIEIGHNGNGNIINSIGLDTDGTVCNPTLAIDYPEQIDTPLEFQKVIGTGTDVWPATPATYPWSAACAKLDPLLQWYQVKTNRDAFAHVSHTFSHEGLNNATYSDVNREITFNQAWLKQVGLAAASKFSSNGLIPPAITGLHNGDAIKAWMTNGITHVVGDNTRPVLREPRSEFWPLISTVVANGYAGLTIVPRWATTIFYNCDLPACTLAEWIATSGGSGDFNNLLLDAKVTNVRHLLHLNQDPFMFHQANLRQSDVASTTVNGVSQQFSLLQIWVETVLVEFIRLVSWPVITLKHDDIANAFINRMARDGCAPKVALNYSTDLKSIVSFTVTTVGNTCSVPIPVTVPTTLVGNKFRTEQIGTDPLTVWVTMTGAPVTLTLAAGVVKL